jgi:hypothetical protein
MDVLDRRLVAQPVITQAYSQRAGQLDLNLLNNRIELIEPGSL